MKGIDEATIRESGARFPAVNRAVRGRWLAMTATAATAGLLATGAMIAAPGAGVAAASGLTAGHGHVARHHRTTAKSSFAAMISSARQESPTHYEGPTTSARAPRSMKIAAITCNSILHGCVSPTIGMQDAVHALDAKGYHWSLQVLNGGGTASQYNAQMTAAIAAGAKVIINIAIDPNSVQAGLRAAKRAGVIVGAGSNGLDSPNPVIRPAKGNLGYAFDVAPNYGALGRKAADWFIGSSKGKANIVVYSDKEFPSVLAVQRGLLAALHACKGCTIAPLQYFVGTQVGTTLGNETVSYLRSHPSTQYVFSPYDPAAASQVPAIANAGMHNVKLMGVLGDAPNLQYIRAGNIQVADAVYDNQYMGYAILDQTIRLLDHKPLAAPEGENLPFAVVDKANLPKAGSDWLGKYPYEGRFLKLWTGR